jgi:hypothetical protein
MREKKESETEAVRRLATSRENRRESSGNAFDFDRCWIRRTSGYIGISEHAYRL